LKPPSSICKACQLDVDAKVDLMVRSIITLAHLLAIHINAEGRGDAAAAAGPAGAGLRRVPGPFAGAAQAGGATDARGGGVRLVACRSVALIAYEATEQIDKAFLTVEATVNRASFGEVLRQAAWRRAGGGPAFALLYIDRRLARQRAGAQGLVALAHAIVALFWRSCGTGGRRQLCTMCIGVAQGIALVVERV
jgi:hypothetical protein